MSKPHIWFSRRYGMWVCGAATAGLSRPKEGMSGKSPYAAYAAWMRYAKEWEHKK